MQVDIKRLCFFHLHIRSYSMLYSTINIQGLYQLIQNKHHEKSVYLELKKTVYDFRYTNTNLIDKSALEKLHPQIHLIIHNHRLAKAEYDLYLNCFLVGRFRVLNSAQILSILRYVVILLSI
jgi:hypothetical protein